MPAIPEVARVAKELNPSSAVAYRRPTSIRKSTYFEKPAAPSTVFLCSRKQPLRNRPALLSQKALEIAGICGPIGAALICIASRPSEGNIEMCRVRKVVAGDDIHLLLAVFLRDKASSRNQELWQETTANLPAAGDPKCLGIFFQLAKSRFTET